MTFRVRTRKEHPTPVTQTAGYGLPLIQQVCSALCHPQLAWRVHSKPFFKNILPDQTYQFLHTDFDSTENHTFSRRSYAYIFLTLQIAASPLGCFEAVSMISGQEDELNDNLARVFTTDWLRLKDPVQYRVIITPHVVLNILHATKVGRIVAAIQLPGSIQCIW